MAKKSSPIVSGGPALGNVPTPDAYLRIKQNIDNLRADVQAATTDANTPRPLTASQLDQVQQALEAGGPNPLNLTALPGILLQLQKSITFGTHAKRLGAAPISYKGSLWAETDRNQGLFYSNGSAWILLAQVGYGTFENRWGDLTVNDQGAQYLETSRNSNPSLQPYPLYRWSGNNWINMEGQFSRNQNGLAVLQATLTPNDTGVQVNVPDYSHRLKWNGNNYNWGDGDEGSGKMVLFEVDPTGPGWHLYDGSSVSYLKQDGTLGSLTLPDLTSNNNAAAYPKAGSPNSGPNAAIAPTFSGNNVNYTPAGTVSISGNNISYTPAGTILALFGGNPMPTHAHSAPIGHSSSTPGMLTTDFGLGATANASSQFALLAPSGTFQTALTEAVSAGTPTGTIAAAFTGTPANFNFTGSATFTGTPANFAISGNISANGEPRNIVRRPWFRQ